MERVGGAVGERHVGERLTAREQGARVEQRRASAFEPGDRVQRVLEVIARCVAQGVAPGREPDRRVGVGDDLDHHVRKPRCAHRMRAVGAVEHHVAALAAARQRRHHRRIAQPPLLADAAHQRHEPHRVVLLVRDQRVQRDEAQLGERVLVGVAFGHGAGNLLGLRRAAKRSTSTPQEP